MDAEIKRNEMSMKSKSKYQNIVTNTGGICQKTITKVSPSKFKDHQVVKDAMKNLDHLFDGL